MFQKNITEKFAEILPANSTKKNLKKNFLFSIKICLGEIFCTKRKHNFPLVLLLLELSPGLYIFLDSSLCVQCLLPSLLYAEERNCVQAYLSNMPYCKFMPTTSARI
jgi:hypothetical protein